MNPHLDEQGYPKNPKSIFIGIGRNYIPHMDALQRSLHGDLSMIGINVKMHGRWENLYGKVTKITQFPDGVVVNFPQVLEFSPLKWPEAVLWIPKHGSAGILN